MKLTELTEHWFKPSIKTVVKKFFQNPSRFVDNYEVGDDGKIEINDENGNMTIEYGDIKDGKIPFEFGKIKHDFTIGANYKNDDNKKSPLTSTWGFPHYVGGQFTVLDLGDVKNMKGFPLSVGKLLVEKSKLTSMEYLPTILNGAQNSVYLAGEFSSFNNAGFPKKIPWRSFGFASPHITSLSGIGDYFESAGGMMSFDGDQVTSSILGLLTINGLTDIVVRNARHQGAWSILKEHLKGNRDVFDCQQELIEAGFEEYAQL